MTAKRKTAAAIARSLAAATGAGLQIARFTVTLDGSVTVEVAPPNPVEAATPKPIDSPAHNVQRLQPKAWAKG